MPYLKLYVRDWLADFHLRGVSIAARGLWADMLCLAWQSDRRGYLEENGQPMTPAQLARRIGARLAEVKPLLTELEGKGVFSRTESGAIYSRRVVEDEKKREQAQHWGKRGGNPALKASLNPTLKQETGMAALNLEPRTQNPDKDTHTAKKPIPPTLEDVKAEAARIGQSPKQAQRFFAYHQARNWQRTDGKPVVKWRESLETWTARGSERSGEHRSNSDGKPRSTVRQPSTWEIKTQLEAVEAELKRAGNRQPSQYASREQHAEWERTPAGQKWAQLRQRRDDLRARLAGLPTPPAR